MPGLFASAKPDARPSQIDLFSLQFLKIICAKTPFLTQPDIPDPLRLEAKQQEAADLSEGAAQTPEPDDDVQTPMSEAADEMLHQPVTYVADAEPGRNDPCSCGSGKKSKHCCMSK